MLETHVVGICGSLRDESVTRAAVRRALDGSADAGATVDLVDLREFDLPLYDADVDPAGDSAALCERVQRADAVILGTPMYHGSYASPLKTALDYMGFAEFETTTVGLLAVSGGSFPVTALEHLRSVVRALDAWVVPYQAAVPKSKHALDENRALADDDLADRVTALGERVVEFAHIEPDPTTFESQQNEGAAGR